MNNFKELEPFIYRIVKGEKDGSYNLRVIDKQYTIKKKLYGPVYKILFRIGRLLNLKLFGAISIISSGKKGLGKTTTSNKICNLLLEKNIPIIEVKYIDINTSIIEFLSNFRNCTIYIDEFGKYFNYEYQEKMLTLLNKTSDYYNIYILGENDLYKINQFLLDRMERIRYHVRHDRISKDDLDEYCKDHGVSDNIISSLNKINSKSSEISYDTLEIIADEHKIFPELDFDELTSIMNCQGIIGVSVIDVMDIQIESDELFVEKFVISEWCRNIREAAFIDGKSKLSITITIGKTVKDDNADKSQVPQGMPNFNIHPMHGSNTMLHNINISSDNIEYINDLDGVITANADYNGKKIHIVLGTKLVPGNTY